MITKHAGRPRKYLPSILENNIVDHINSINEIVIGRVYGKDADIRIVTGLTIKRCGKPMVTSETLGFHSAHLKRVWFDRLYPDGVVLRRGAMWSKNFKKWINGDGSYTGMTIGEAR